MDQQAQIDEYLKKAKEIADSKEDGKFMKAYGYAEKILELDPGSVPGWLLKCRYYGATEKKMDNAKELESFTLLAQLTDRLTDEQLQPWKAEMAEICEWHINNCCVTICMSMLASPSIQKVGDAVKTMNNLFAFLSYIECGTPEFNDREDLRKLKDAHLPVNTKKCKDSFATILSSSVGVAVSMQDLTVSMGAGSPAERQKLKDFRLAAMMADRCALEYFASSRASLDHLRKDYDKVTKASGLSGDQFDSINNEFNTIYQQKMKEAVKQEEEEARSKVAEAMNVDSAAASDPLERAIRATEAEQYLEAEILANQVLEQDFRNSAAWIIRSIALGYKGRSSGYMPRACRDCWANAWAYAEPEQKDAVADLISDAFCKVGIWYIQAASERRGAGVGKKDIDRFREALNEIQHTFIGFGDFDARSSRLSPLVDALLDEGQKIIRDMSKVTKPTNQLALVVYALVMTEPIIALQSLLGHHGFGNDITSMGTVDQYLRAQTMIKTLEGMLASTKSSFDNSVMTRLSQSGRSSFASRTAQQVLKPWKDAETARQKAHYWEVHPEEKVELEQQIGEANAKIKQLNAQLESIPEIREKESIDRETRETSNYLSSLGFLKFREKKQAEEKLNGLKQRQRTLYDIISRQQKKLKDAISAEQSGLRKLEDQLKNPVVTPDGHLPQLPLVSDGHFTVTSEGFADQFSGLLEAESYYLDVTKSDKWPATKHYIHAYKRTEKNEKNFGNMLFTLNLDCREEDGLIELIDCALYSSDVNEKNGACPPKTLALAHFLSLLLPSLSLEADRETVVTAFMETVTELKGTGPVYLNFDPVTYVAYKGGDGSFLKWHIRILPFHTDPPAPAVLRALRGMEEHIPTVDDWSEMAKRSLRFENFQDLLSTGDKILKTEPLNPLALCYKATGLACCEPDGELSEEVKKLFRQSVEALKPERYGPRMDIIQSCLGTVLSVRETAVYKAVRDLPLSSEIITRMINTVDQYRQFLFDFEAETGIVLSAEKTMNHSLFNHIRELTGRATLNNSPKNAADISRNEQIAGAMTTVISSARIQGPPLVHGIISTRNAFSVGSAAEKTLSSGNRFGGNLCASSEAKIADNKINEYLDAAISRCKSTLASRGDLIPAEECERFANWKKDFTLNDLYSIISAHLPAEYSLTLEEMPENVRTHVNPFKERRIYLHRAGADNMFISLAGISAEDNGPLEQIYIEGTVVGGQIDTLTEEFAQFGLLSAFAIRCLAPSMPLEKAIEYACGIIADKSYSQTIENITMWKDYGVSIIVSPTRLFISKKPEEEKK